MAVARGNTLALPSLTSKTAASYPTTPGGGLARQSTPAGINMANEESYSVASTQTSARAQDASNATTGTTLNLANIVAPIFAGLTAIGTPQSLPNAFGDANPNTVEQYYSTPSGGTIAYVWEGVQQWWNGGGVFTFPGYNQGGVENSNNALLQLTSQNPALFQSPSAGSGATPTPASPAPTYTATPGTLGTLLPWLSSLAPSQGTTGAGDLPGTSTPISALGALQPIGTPTSTSTSGSPNVVIIVVALVLVGVGVFWYLHNKHKATHQGAPRAT